ncbi:hypothetical protein DFJ77DRAFT_448652 [Powellomyces hirtus]|nr:hypothetical protein DFJ77DRAFT_448652 [Powellomyces hirtus]
MSRHKARGRGTRQPQSTRCGMMEDRQPERVPGSLQNTKPQTDESKNALETTAGRSSGKRSIWDRLGDKVEETAIKGHSITPRQPSKSVIPHVSLSRARDLPMSERMARDMVKTAEPAPTAYGASVCSSRLSTSSLESERPDVSNERPDSVYPSEEWASIIVGREQTDLVCPENQGTSSNDVKTETKEVEVWSQSSTTDWILCRSRTSGKPYYYNQLTNESVWKTPRQEQMEKPTEVAPTPVVTVGGVQNSEQPCQPKGGIENSLERRYRDSVGLLNAKLSESIGISRISDLEESAKLSADAQNLSLAEVPLHTSLMYAAASQNMDRAGRWEEALQTASASERQSERHVSLGSGVWAVPLPDTYYSATEAQHNRSLIVGSMIKRLNNTMPSPHV